MVRRQVSLFWNTTFEVQASGEGSGLEMVCGTWKWESVYGNMGFVCWLQQPILICLRYSMEESIFLRLCIHHFILFNPCNSHVRKCYPYLWMRTQRLSEVR